MDLYTEDVTLTVAADTGPNPGVYEGKEAVGEWFGDWFRTFAAEYHFAVDEARPVEGGAIFLHANHGGSGRLSGAEMIVARFAKHMFPEVHESQMAGQRYSDLVDLTFSLFRLLANCNDVLPIEPIDLRLPAQRLGQGRRWIARSA